MKHIWNGICGRPLFLVSPTYTVHKFNSCYIHHPFLLAGMHGWGPFKYPINSYTGYYVLSPNLTIENLIRLPRVGTDPQLTTDQWPGSKMGSQTSENIGQWAVFFLWRTECSVQACFYCSMVRMSYNSLAAVLSCNHRGQKSRGRIKHERTIFG